MPVVSKEAITDHLRVRAENERLRAEIERLRTEVQTWINHTKAAVWSDSEECKFLTAENARLRAALEAFQAMMENDNYCAGEVLVEFSKIARAALGAENNPPNHRKGVKEALSSMEEAGNFDTPKPPEAT